MTDQLSSWAEQPVVICTYGPSGIGKSTDMGYSFPNALFIAAPGAGITLGDIGYSRQVDFDLTLLTGSTTRTFKWPDEAGTIALIENLVASYVSNEDIDVSAGSDGDMLRHNGTKFVATNKAGNASVPVDGIYVNGVSGNTNLRITNGGGFASRLVDRGGAMTMSSDHEHGLPDADGAILLDSTNLKQVTVTIPFVAGTSGLFDMLVNDRNGHLFFALNSTTLLRGSSQIKKLDYQWCGYTNEPAVATPIELNVYNAGALPTATTAPPAGAGAALVSNIPILSSAQYLSGTIAGAATIFLNTNHFFFLAIAAGSGVPTISGHLVLNIEYVVNTGEL